MAVAWANGGGIYPVTGKDKKASQDIFLEHEEQSGWRDVNSACQSCDFARIHFRTIHVERPLKIRMTVGKLF